MIPSQPVPPPQPLQDWKPPRSFFSRLWDALIDLVIDIKEWDGWSVVWPLLGTAVGCGSAVCAAMWISWRKEVPEPPLIFWGGLPFIVAVTCGPVVALFYAVRSRMPEE